MAKDTVIITSKGAKELETKLEYLKTKKRSEISQQIKVAREFGDLSENAEYDEAKNEQARVETEIINIEKMLMNATIVNEKDISTDVVNVGAVVKIYDNEFKEEVEYHIVGIAEVDLTKNYISNESPVGAALIGNKVGDKVKVKTPGGIITFKILDIHR